MKALLNTVALSAFCNMSAGAAAEAAGAPAEQPETEQPRVDPFADLPVVQLGDGKVAVKDLSGVDASAPRKYEKAHTAAIGEKLPIMKGWKHSRAVFVPGTTKEFRPGSVFGTIQDLVGRAGRTGIASYELASALRMAQAGNNKRSHYCEKLPPVGWAEGYLNSAVTQGLIKVHATKQADPLVVAAAEKAGDKAQAEEKASASK